MSGALQEGRSANARRRRAELRAITHRLAGVLRMVRIHAPDNRATLEAADELAGRLRQLVAELGGLLLRVDGQVVRVNGAVLATLGRSALKEVNALASDLETRGLGGIRIDAPPSTEELLGFLGVWRSAGVRGAERLSDELIRAEVRSLGVVPPRPPAEPESADLSDAEDLEQAVRACCALLAVGELLSTPATAALQATERRAEAALHAAVDVVVSAPLAMLCAATHRDAARYEAVHAANTAVLAMLLARAVGLGLEGLLDVGRGALFSDLGMHTAAPGVRDHPGELDSDAVRRVLAHPVESLAVGLAGGRMEAADRARLVVALEHHYGVHGEGYPAPSLGHAPHLYSRICAVADGYDALVHDRGDRPGLPRSLALEVLQEEASHRLDARLLREFFAMTGRFPPGSVVRLQEGWIAMTATPSLDPRMFDRPDVIVIRNPQGRPCKPRLLPLGEQRGERSTRIAEVLDDRLFPERLIPLMLEL